MSTNPRAPRLRKGAIVGVELLNPLASVTVFQYNPSELERSLSERARPGSTPDSEGRAPRGAPKETINLSIELDACDRLERDDPVANQIGVYPQLAALEMLLYPKSIAVIADFALAMLGSLELSPRKPEGMTLFIWGPMRVLPIKLTSLSVSEKLYDANLNPIRATVKLGLTVLTYDELGARPASFVYLAHQVAKEAMAVVGSVDSLTRLEEVL